ncbi:hypothetical protein [Glycomyces rhizosphaerae]|uniref:Uncharacterized protein n=1 Tax=Glycomyces rhizosphaerae TaxID=2054422 RepID=A0ABV7PTU8_9ACTN
MRQVITLSAKIAGVQIEERVTATLLNRLQGPADDPKTQLVW